MPPSQARSITISGLYESGVLGTFAVIRGFADLRDLARISAPYEMHTGADQTVTGHQRPLDAGHAADIRRYLEGGAFRFLPEVILSLRVPLAAEEKDGMEVGVQTVDPSIGITLARRWQG